MLRSAEEIPDEKVSIKLSVCNGCDGIVRAAVEHLMDVKMKNEFMREVMQYNLSVKSIPLLEYRKQLSAWCKCEPDPLPPLKAVKSTSTN